MGSPLYRNSDFASLSDLARASEQLRLSIVVPGYKAVLNMKKLFTSLAD